MSMVVARLLLPTDAVVRSPDHCCCRRLRAAVRAHACLVVVGNGAVMGTHKTCLFSSSCVPTPHWRSCVPTPSRRHICCNPLSSNPADRSTGAHQSFFPSSALHPFKGPMSLSSRGPANLPKNLSLGRKPVRS